MANMDMGVLERVCYFLGKHFPIAPKSNHITKHDRGSVNETICRANKFLKESFSKRI